MTANLLSRLKGLTGPDRVIDAEIYALLGGAPHTTTAGGRTVPLIERGDPNSWPSYTASLDAAVALCERVLPGWERSMSSIHPDFRSVNEPRFTADLAGPISLIKDTETGAIEPHCETHCGKGISEAIALLIAILTALEARDNGN